LANQSGYNATLAVGAYAGASLDDVRVSVNHEPVDVTDLSSKWRERAPGLLQWEVTGTKKYATQAFLTLAKAGTTSVVVRVSPPSGTVFFSALGFVTRGAANFPMGAAGEEISVVGGAYNTAATQQSTPVITSTAA
jgi:hypothetical protein